MANYEAHYRSVGFDVSGEWRRFKNGTDTTEDADEITVLDAITDVKRVEDLETTEAKPAPKAPAKRTASAK